MSHILTEQINPPIPTPGFDWRAVFDGYEPGDPIGYGRSEEDAVSALFESRELEQSVAAFFVSREQDEAP